RGESNQPQFGAYNIATAARQPGSSFKPIVYATAFKGNLNPATTVFDLKTDFGGGYTPQNFTGTFSGPVTLRYALGNSLNIPAVKTLALTGVDKVLKTASDFGYTTLNGGADNYGLSLALGSGEVTLLDHTAAYGVFANQGTYVPTSPVLKITDTKNNVVYDHTKPTDAKQVLDPQIAYEISNMLSDTNAKKPVFAHTMGVLSLSDRPVAVKTGTTNSNHDAWTMGYIPQIAVGVWAGNNDNSPMNSGGSMVAAPIWHSFMAYAASKYPAQQFTQPDGIQTVQVDKLSNKLPVNGSDVISDIFARWQVPTKQDDVHQQVRVCRENGLLADSSISDALAEIRTYTYVHSEMPNNPNWENPVRAWAAANGYNNAPPTQKCTADNSTTPSISITSPSNGATVSGNFDIIASASAPSGVASVDFAIDNTVILTDTSAPYQTSYNAANLSAGSHTISATVTSVSGSTANTQITINVSNDTTPPHDISGFTGTPQLAAVHLTWTNPSDSDFAAVHIYYRKQNSGGSYSSVSVTGSPSQAGSTTISGLVSHTAYEFLAKATDTSGNESGGVTIYLTPL
ncbi:MAG TPA: penicillin-binding transpeptidase domain-containing protein, partial [Candidatus Saccharimonadales bacterium]|nr:penicillin-binding transpeptidase domain-containing protein [Candidatus Saccharimonadales bacterium]